MIECSDAEVEKARELLAAFLEGMPEIVVDLNTTIGEEIASGAYNGDFHAYIRESFDNFLDQCTAEMVEEDGR